MATVTIHPMPEDSTTNNAIELTAVNNNNNNNHDNHNNQNNEEKHLNNGDALNNTNGKSSSSSLLSPSGFFIPCSYSSLTSSDIMMGWKDLSILSSSPPAKIIAGSSAFVRKGKTMAILGPSGCGKTALMKTLCGREPDLSVSGQIYLDGKSVNLSKHQSIAFVPQEDLLIGELTVRETLTISARLRRSDDRSIIDRDVQNLIDALGLKKVGDNAIGTVLKRGLSGGEKRRVAVGVELIAGAKVIFLDEPTSGLDAWTAYQVIKTIRDICHSSNQSISIVCALHQPNTRILELFDDLLLIDRGRTVYFGSVPDSLSYFDQLGFPCPSSSTPTDYFIHVVDKRFAFLSDDDNNNEEENNDHQGPPSTRVSADLVSEKEKAIYSNDNNNNNNKLMEKTPPKSSHNVDFVSHYRLSSLHSIVHSLLEDIGKTAHEKMLSELGNDDNSIKQTKSFWRQLKVLTQRNAIVAFRDVTLYWLQFVMTCMFGFMVGIFFWNLPKDINKRVNDISNGIVWISFVGTYIHSFGVYHQMEMKKRYHHERSNGSVTTLSWTLADLLINLPAAYIAFVPGLLIAYFMMRLPNDSVPFFLFVLGFMTWTAHAMVGFLGQLVKTTPSASLLAQGNFVIFSLFAGGSFVRWSKLGFWIWTSVISVYTWSTRAMMASVYDHIDYKCTHNPFEGIELSTTTNSCMYNSINYPCIAGTMDTTNQSCLINGRIVLDQSKGVDYDENKWFGAGLVVVLFVAFRILVFLFLKYPIHIYFPRLFSFFFNNKLASALIRAEDEIEIIAARLRMMETTVKELKQGEEQQKKECPQIGNNNNNNNNTNAATNPPNSVSIMIRQSSFSPSLSSLHWENLTLTLKGKGTKLVTDVNGYATGGRILAVMGPSGAGKTTLLNALSGRAPYAEINGSVMIGNRKLRQNDLTYVPQFDSLNPVLSVYETFMTNARLMNKENDNDDSSNNNNNNNHSIRKSVAELINVLGLSEKFNKSVGSLTSGERKRISIGLGLIAHPNILFLDEPTTGLDSEAALAVVDYMFRIVRRTGVICLVTLHQPSSQIWSRLDDLLLLSQGKTAYFGTAKAAEAYFASVGFNVPPNTNPSDYYLDCINRSPAVTLEADYKRLTEANNNVIVKPSLPSGVVIDDSTIWNDLYSKHCDKPNFSSVSKDNPPDIERPSEWSRLMILISAHLSYYKQETAIYPFRFLQMLLLAIFIGTVFLRRANEMESLNELHGALFFSVWSTLFAAISATPTFVRNHLIMGNEYLNGYYQLHTHQLAAWIASLPYHAITATVYQLIMHFLVGFHDNFESWLFATLTTLVLLSLMEGISQSIVEVFRDANLATTFSMNILGMFFLFPGFFIKEDDMVRSVFWLSYIVPTRYALNSQLDMIFRHQTYRTNNAAMPFVSGEEILDRFWKIDTGDYNKWGDWGIVVLFLFGFRMMHYALTKFNYRKYAR